MMTAFTSSEVSTPHAAGSPSMTRVMSTGPSLSQGDARSSLGRQDRMRSRKSMLCRPKTGPSAPLVMPTAGPTSAARVGWRLGRAATRPISPLTSSVRLAPESMRVSHAAESAELQFRSRSAVTASTLGTLADAVMRLPRAAERFASSLDSTARTAADRLVNHASALASSCRAIHCMAWPAGPLLACVPNKGTWLGARSGCASRAAS